MSFVKLKCHIDITGSVCVCVLSVLADIFSKLPTNEVNETVWADKD